MERKIGEIFEYNGEWYQCIVGNGCENCAFNERKCYTFTDNNDPIGDCCAEGRKDNKDVIFKKLEKVGEPYMLEDKKFQKYRVFKTPYIYNKIDYSWQSFADPYYISLEIKQNKEDMEEKKLNLKPFDIQKAREGKPVCTRGGRKARIIYFNAKGDYPIVALIETENGERVGQYMIDGHCTDIISQCCDDLMMLPEKKEGWVNVYKDGLLGARVYKTRKEAYDIANPCDYVDTVKISWEE